MGAAALLLRARNAIEIVPTHQPLQSFPAKFFDGWSSTDLPLSKDVLEVLGPGDFLTREYQTRFQRAAGWLIHRLFPQPAFRRHNPFAQELFARRGMGSVAIGPGHLNLPGKAPFQANRYLIALGQDRQLVLYWYWAHERAVASEYWAKYYLVADSIRMRRSDGSLIRLTTKFMPGESMDSAQKRLLGLADNISPVIDNYVPR